MPTLKEYKTKLQSLVNTKKVTKTMKLVSASKLRQVQIAQSKAKVYAAELTGLIARLAASVEGASHILLHPVPDVKNILVLVITSDKGLCGGFNNNLSKQVFQWHKARKDQLARIDLSFCGKRGWMFFKSRLPIKTYYEGVTNKPQFSTADRIGKELIRAFISGEYQEIYLAYNRYNNPISQTPQIDKLLPIEPESLLKTGKALGSDYILEPSESMLLDFLLPKYFYFRIFYALLENSAGEHGARMSAMDKATQSATELIDKYTLLRNRARQAAITKELIEIVSGAEAFK